MKHFRRELLILAGIATTWAVAWFGLWYAEMGCLTNFSQMCFDATGEWASRVILLGWLKDYQTIVAGLAAVSAFLVPYFQRRIDRQDAIDAEVTRKVQLLWFLRSLYTRVEVAISNHRHDEAMQTLPSIENSLSELVKINPGIANLVTIQCSDIRKILADQEAFPLRAAGITHMMRAFLEHPSRFFDDDGTYNPSPIEWNDAFAKMAADRRLTAEDLALRLAMFVDK